MDVMFEVLQNVITDYTLRTVDWAPDIGNCERALGSFAVLRKQSLLGMRSLMRLCGIALAFLLTGSRPTGISGRSSTGAGWVRLYPFHHPNHRIKMIVRWDLSCQFFLE